MNLSWVIVTFIIFIVLEAVFAVTETHVTLESQTSNTQVSVNRDQFSATLRPGSYHVWTFKERFAYDATVRHTTQDVMCFLKSRRRWFDRYEYFRELRGKSRVSELFWNEQSLPQMFPFASMLICYDRPIEVQSIVVVLDKEGSKTPILKMIALDEDSKMGSAFIDESNRTVRIWEAIVVDQGSYGDTICFLLYQQRDNELRQSAPFRLGEPLISTNGKAVAIGCQQTSRSSL